MEAYLERHRGRYCLVAEVLDGVFIQESQRTPMDPNEQEQLPWLSIKHKATTAIMCHDSHALRLLLLWSLYWLNLLF
jgi:hypothetical protein